MENRMRRFEFHCLIGLAILGLAFSSHAPAQDFQRSPSSGRLTVPADREVLHALDEARLMIARKQYHPAAQLLQLVLDRPEDSFIGKDFSSRENRSGTKSEALRLLASQPPEGRAAYEAEYGPTARARLDEAQRDNNLEQTATVARQYSQTSAGFDAVQLLAAHASDSGRPLEAALLLETLRTHPLAVSKRTPSLVLQAAACWSRAGQPERSRAALSELKAMIPSGKLRVGGKDVTLFERDEDATGWLSRLLGPNVRLPLAVVDVWTMPGGGPTRNESAVSASPVGGDRWHVSLFDHLTLDGRPVVDRQRREQLAEMLQQAKQSLLDEDRLAIPAAQPLVIGDIVVYRTLGNVTAVSLRSGELLWRSSVTDEGLLRLIRGRSTTAPQRTFRDATGGTASLLSHLRRRAFRDEAAGTITSDGQSVFALEDLEANTDMSFANMRGMEEPRVSNKLVAYDLFGGRMLWEVGGPRGSKPEELSALFFLGPPLPVDGRLYSLVETQGSLQLLVLAPSADRQSISIDWSQTLIATERPLTTQPLRRLAGLSPSLADGIVVCPTSSGAVVAVDTIRRVVKWGYQYKSSAPSELEHFGMPAFQRIPQQQQFQLEEADETARWLDSAPTIADGRVLLTPRDADELHCVDLLDGQPLWTIPRGDWLLVACVIDGHVILMGREGLGAVQLADGKPVDTFRGAALEPTGRGVRVGSAYYMPSTSGEIATIDLRNGMVLARSKLARGSIPGNLVAGGGAVVSQNSEELVGFSRLEEIERRIADELRQDPQHPAALALRGELRLQRGDEAEGLADLRESLKRQPDPRVKSVLATALLAGGRANPQLIRDRAGELEILTTDPQQRNEFLQLYSRALEAAGDRRGAFTQIIRLAETARFLNGVDDLSSGHSVRTDRLIRGRIVEMYAAAAPDERIALDRALEQHITATAKGEDRLEHLGRCLRFFRGLPHADSVLFESLAASDQPMLGEHSEQLLEQFTQSSNPSVAARATALLARDLLKSNRPGQALPLIQRLRNEFADRPCLDGKTGRNLAGEWFTREDVSGLLAATSPWSAGARFQGRTQREAAAQRTNVPTEIVSQQGTQFAGWSFETDPTGSLLMARDATGRHRWKVAIPADAAFNDIVGRNLNTAAQLFFRDDWLVLSFGTYFVAINASSDSNPPRVAWQQTLRTSATTPAEIMFRNQAGLRVLPNGRVLRPPVQQRTLGQFVGLTGETAIYILGTKLIAAELETGRLAWSRQDVITRQSDASADDRVVAVRLNGSSEMQLFRTLDGRDVAKRKWRIVNDSAYWSRGALHLVAQSSSDGREFEMRDLERDRVIWNRTCPDGTEVAVIEDEDVAFVEPTGRATVLRLIDGRPQYSADLTIKLPATGSGWIAVQRMEDRDIFLGGGAAKMPSRTQIVPFDALNQNGVFVFDGQVCAASRSDGKLLWATPVEQMIFDRTQPSRLPLLLLASRVHDLSRAGNPFGQTFRLNAKVIDKQNGGNVYSTEENSPAMSPRLEPDPDNHRIIVNFHDWQLDVSFAERKPDKP
jgi:outer membrane protein assembly factor BamB/tetratricopeptide (TPR) repeat protein